MSEDQRVQEKGFCDYLNLIAWDMYPGRIVNQDICSQYITDVHGFMRIFYLGSNRVYLWLRSIPIAIPIPRV